MASILQDCEQRIPHSRATLDSEFTLSKKPAMDPEVVAYLLERPVRNPNVATHNVDLRRLIAAGSGCANRATRPASWASPADPLQNAQREHRA